MVTVAMRFDMRAPSFSPVDPKHHYRTAIEQAAWADENGFDTVVVSEHHGVDDGYLPSPMVLASALAAVTGRVSINISALLAPLHDPLRLAEDLAILDLVSGGRLSVVLGLGYRPEEYGMFDREWKRRGKLLDEVIEVLLQAWTGEPFEFRGRTVQVTPRPLQRPHPLLFVGGSGPAGARRAARFGLPFFPALNDDEVTQVYLDEFARHGHRHPLVLLPSGPGFVYVADDPDRAWAEVGRYIFHDASVYASWQQPGQTSHVTDHAGSIEELRAGGVYRILTPDECIALDDEMGPSGTFIFHPLIGGMPPELAWPSLELFATKVLPAIRPAA